MATTTNFGWETPDDTDLVKDGAAAIRTALGGVDTSFVDLKGGTTGQVLSKASNTDLDYTWISSGSAISPNLIINGAFIVNQRGYVSATNLASGAYGFDRWKSTFTNTSLTFTAGVNATTVTISSGGSIKQIIERENVPAGTYTLSWSGTATARVYNTGGTPGSYAASPVTFTADGLANVEVEFTASGGTRTLGLVKFERGSSATTYSLAGGNYQGELAACQRYYYRLTPTSGAFGLGWTFSTTGGINVISFPVTMRIAPSALEQSGTAAHYNLTHTFNLTVCSAVPTYNGATIQSGTVTVTVASGFTAGQGTLLNANNTAAYLGWSAEL